MCPLILSQIFTSSNTAWTSPFYSWTHFFVTHSPFVCFILDKSNSSHFPKLAQIKTGNSSLKSIHRTQKILLNFPPCSLFFKSLNFTFIYSRIPVEMKKERQNCQPKKYQRTKNWERQTENSLQIPYKSQNCTGKKRNSLSPNYDEFFLTNFPNFLDTSSILLFANVNQ